MDKQIWITIISGVFTGVVTPMMAKVVVPWVKKFGVKPPRPPKPTPLTPLRVFLLAGAGGVVGVLVGYFVVSPIVGSPCLPCAPTSVYITSPVPGTEVPRLTTVQGTACHIPKDEELWLLVLPEGVTAYYPQAGPIVVTSDGTWATSVYVGLDDPADVGRGFVIVAALADETGSAIIHQYFDQDGAQGYVGLEPLPPGIQLIAQTHVIRR